MRLADFILRNMESILAKWEAFAATRLPAAASMTSLELTRSRAADSRGGCCGLVGTSIARKRRPLSRRGSRPPPSLRGKPPPRRMRLCGRDSGYDIKQLVSEYRALRASVLSLWMDACLPAAPPLQDVIRFNEAIDQAVAESIGTFQRAGGPGAKPTAWNAQPRHAQPLANGADDGAISWAA